MGSFISGLQPANIKPTHLEQLKSWVSQHPTTLKVLKMAGLSLGIGLLIAPFFIAGFGIPVKTSLAITGGAFSNTIYQN